MAEVRAGLLCLAAVVPAFFLRSTQSVFIVPQVVATLLICLGAAGCHVVAVSGDGRRWLWPGALRWAATFFVVGLSLTVAASPLRWTALTGLHARGAGAATYLAFVVLLYVGSQTFRTRSCRPLLLALLGTQGLVAGYGLLQASGNDPFEWADQISFGVDALSTLGNPNFSSALVAIVVPITLRFVLGRDVARPIRFGATSLLVLAMGGIAHMSSFQGNVVAVTSLGVLACWVLLQVPERRLEAGLLSAPLAVIVLLYPLVDPRPEAMSVLVVGVALGALVALIMMRERVWQDGGSGVLAVGGRRLATVPLRWRLAALGCLGIGGLFLAGPFLLREFRDGLSTRRGFFEVGLEILSERPILGTGLETFESYYTALRPVEHAVTEEVTRTDSIHSVVLGMFTGGGLVLGLTYLALVGVIGWFGIRAVRRAEGDGRLEAVALLSAWVGFHLQSAISVDIPALGVVHWLLGAVLVARGGDDLFEERRIDRRLPRWLVPTVAFVGVFVVAIPILAPLRADRAAHRAVEAMDAGDLAGAVAYMEEAVDLQHRDGRHAEAYGHTLLSVGRADLALQEYQRDQALRPGRPGSSVNVAVAAVQLNLLEDAATALEQAIADDPYAASLVAEAALFYASIGRVQRAEELVDRHRLLGSHLGADVIAQARYHLGEG